LRQEYEVYRRLFRSEVPVAEPLWYDDSLDFVEGRPGEVRDTALDTRRAAQVLDWRAATQLRDGLRQTLTSFRERARRSPAHATAVPAGAEATQGRGSPAGSG